MSLKGQRSRILFAGTMLLLGAAVAGAQGIPVTPYTLPPAGVDNMQVSMIETYTINGVGTDTVSLTGTLVTSRGTPLLGPGETTQSWDTSTVVAQFTSLDVSGNSPLFGPVHVTLNPNHPTYAAVKAGKCAAATSVMVSLPTLGLSLRTATAVQLQSTVNTIPPIGTQETHSVGGPTNLVDSSGRVVGTLDSAQVVWRQLDSQTPYGGSSPSTAASLAPAQPSKTAKPQTAAKAKLHAPRR